MNFLARLLARLRLPAWAIVVLVLFVSSSCANVAKKSILSANDLQDAAAKAYSMASDQEYLAGRLCGTALCPPGATPHPLNALGCPLPTATEVNVQAILDTCAKVGTPLPYDPFKLKKLAGPLNASYEAVRFADTVRQAVDKGQAGDTSGAILKAAMSLLSVYNAANDMGIKLPLDGVVGLLNGVPK